MATIGPTGDYDFSSLVTWEASLPATLTAVAVLDCADFALEEAAGCVFDVVTSTDFYIDMHTSGGARPGRAPRTVSGAGFSYSSSNSSGTIRFATGCNHVRLDGIELIGTVSATPVAWPGTPAAGANDFRFENCILHDALTGTANTLPASKTNLNLTLRNTIIFGSRRTMDTRSSASVVVENCTFWRHENQLGVVSDTELVCKNTYNGHVGALEAFWTGSAAPTGNNNATSDPAIPDYTSSLTSIAGADVFVSVTPGAENFALKVGTNALVDAGATLGTVTTDIAGLARPSGAAYDIGAAERDDSGGATNYNLTAQAVISSAATLGLAALSQVHVVSGVLISSGAPTLSTPSVSQVHVLLGMPIAASPPVLGSPAVSLGAINHPFIGVTISSSPPIVGLAQLSQDHNLAGAQLVTSPPTLGTPTVLSDLYNLTGEAIVCSPAILTSPSLSQDHVLGGSAIAAGAPTFGTPTVTQQHALLAQPIVSRAPTLGNPVLSIVLASPFTTEETAYLDSIIPTVDDVYQAVVARLIADGVIPAPPIVQNNIGQIRIIN